MPAAKLDTPSQIQQANAWQTEADRAVEDEAWSLAAEKATLALRAREEAFGKESIEVAPPLVALGRALVGRHAYEKAEATLSRAKDLIVKHRGPEHGDLGIVLESLGDAAAGRSDLVAAQARHEQSLAVRKKAFGPSSVETARALVALASTHYDRGARNDARPLLVLAVDILEKTDSPVRMADALDNLAQVYEDLDRHQDAFAAYQRASMLLEKNKLADSPKNARVLRHWSNLMSTMGDLAHARALATRALAILERTYKPDEPQMSYAWRTLGQIELEEGDIASAEKHLLRALEIAQDAVGVDHLETASALLELAEVYVHKSNYKQAIAIDKKVVEIRERALGAEHPSVATAYNNLASVYWEAHQFNRAKGLYKKALAVYEKVSGPESLDTATALHNIGTVYYMQSKYDQALPLFERALAIDERLAPKAMKTGIAAYNLGMLYMQRGDLQKTRALFEKTLPIYEGASREQHPDFLKLLDAMTMLYQRLGDTAALERTRERANRARGNVDDSD